MYQEHLVEHPTHSISSTNLINNVSSVTHSLTHLASSITSTTCMAPIHRITLTLSIHTPSLTSPPVNTPSILLHLHPLPLLLSLPQLRNSLIARTSIPNLLIIYKFFRATRIFALPHLFLTVKIGAADIERVDVAWDDASEKAEAVY